MKRIGIIGDVHAEHDRLSMTLGYLESLGVDEIVCTGDIADGRGDLTRCCELLEQKKVLTVAGNHDRWFLSNKVRHVQGAHLREHISCRTIAFMEGLPKTLTLQTCSGSLILCHGMLEDDLAKIWPGSENTASKCSESLDTLLEQSNPPRYIINGHMHFRTLIDFPRTQVVNAGTLKGQYSGFSLIDIQENQLDSYNLSENGEVFLVSKVDLTAMSERRVWRSTDDFDGNWQPVVLHRTQAGS